MRAVPADTVLSGPGLVSPGGATFTIPVRGQTFVLPTEYKTRLPGNNEYVLAAAAPTSANFVNSEDVDSGLLNMAAPWLAVIDSAGPVECFIFTGNPQAISYVRDVTGLIYELCINPGNALVYKVITFMQDQTTDTNGDLIPDFLDRSVAGSLAEILYSYGVTGFEAPPYIRPDQWGQLVTADNKNFITSDSKYFVVRSGMPYAGALYLTSDNKNFITSDSKQFIARL